MTRPFGLSNHSPRNPKADIYCDSHELIVHARKLLSTSVRLVLAPWIHRWMHEHSYALDGIRRWLGDHKRRALHQLSVTILGSCWSSVTFNFASCSLWVTDPYMTSTDSSHRGEPSLQVFASILLSPLLSRSFSLQLTSTSSTEHHSVSHIIITYNTSKHLLARGSLGRLLLSPLISTASTYYWLWPTAIRNQFS